METTWGSFQEYVDREKMETGIIISERYSHKSVKSVNIFNYSVYKNNENFY